MAKKKLSYEHKVNIVPTLTVPMNGFDLELHITENTLRDQKNRRLGLAKEDFHIDLTFGKSGIHDIKPRFIGPNKFDIFSAVHGWPEGSLQDVVRLAWNKFNEPKDLF